MGKALREKAMLKMKKLISMLLLTVMSTNVIAEWTVVGNSGDSELTIYADIATIRKKGNKVEIWSLKDFKKTQWEKERNGKYKYLSTISRSEYDCEEETMQVLSLTQYSKNMGEGNIVWSSNKYEDINSFEIIPGSIGEAVLKIACSTK
jgi:hypothetical protein